MLDRLTAIPYNLELRDTIDAALYRLDQLDEAAKRCIASDKEFRTMRGVDPKMWQEKTRQQTHIFDNLEAFLTGWARVSLWFYPVSECDDFTRLRAATLRSIFAVDASSPLADRELRNSWMHHDERLDRLVANDTLGSRQLFKRSSEVTNADKERCPRIIEIDTLMVHFHDRNGGKRCVNLRDLRHVLENLDAQRDAAFDKLPMPPEEDASQ